MQNGKKIRNSEDAVRFAREVRDKALRSGRATLYFEPIGKQFHCRTKGKELDSTHDVELVGVYAGEVRARDIADDINYTRKLR